MAGGITATAGNSGALNTFGIIVAIALFLAIWEITQL